MTINISGLTPPRHKDISHKEKKFRERLARAIQGDKEEYKSWTPTLTPNVGTLSNVSFDTSHYTIRTPKFVPKGNENSTSYVDMRVRCSFDLAGATDNALLMRLPTEIYAVDPPSGDLAPVGVGYAYDSVTAAYSICTGMIAWYEMIRVSQLGSNWSIGTGHSFFLMLRFRREIR